MLSLLCMLGCRSTETCVSSTSGAQHTCPVPTPPSRSVSLSLFTITECRGDRNVKVDRIICLVLFAFPHHLLVYDSMATQSVKLRGRRLCFTLGTGVFVCVIERASVQVRYLVEP